MPSISEIEGIGPTVADKLARIGITEVEELASADVKKLEEAGITENRAKTLIDKAQGFKVRNMMFKTGKEALRERKTINKLTTNIPELDELLGGGIETKSLTEFYGEFGSGKSQFVHQLAVNAMLPVEKGGLGGSVIWIDTERTCRLDSRLPEMIRGVERIHGIKLDVDECIDRITLARPMTSSEQIRAVEESFELAKSIAASGQPPVRMIIVDSLTSNFRAEYCGRDKLPERQHALLEHMNAIYRFAEEFNAVGIVTNQVQSNPATFFGDPIKPIGGNIVGHTSKTRIYCRKSKKGSRVARLVDSPDRPDGEAIYYIWTAGLVPFDWGPDTSPKAIIEEEE